MCAGSGDVAGVMVMVVMVVAHGGGRSGQLGGVRRRRLVRRMVMGMMSAYHPALEVRRFGGSAARSGSVVFWIASRLGGLRWRRLVLVRVEIVSGCA